MLQDRVVAPRKITGIHLRKWHATYKHEFDRRRRETPAFHTGEYILLDKPPVSNESDSQDELLARKSYNKLQVKDRNIAHCKHTKEYRHYWRMWCTEYSIHPWGGSCTVENWPNSTYDNIGTAGTWPIKRQYTQWGPWQPVGQREIRLRSDSQTHRQRRGTPLCWSTL